MAKDIGHTEVIFPPSREAWLELRKQTIGASEAAALVSSHPWLTSLQLWAIKTGRLMPAPETPAMRRGRLLESAAIDFLREERPAWTITPNPMPGGKFYRNHDIGLSCTPDAFIIDPEREGTGVCQIKSVTPDNFIKYWSSEDGIDPPVYAAIQVMIDAILSGAQWACLAPLVIDYGIELSLVEVPIYHPMLEILFRRSRGFWDSISNDEIPSEFDFARDGMVLAGLYAGKPTEAIDLSGLNEVPELLDEYNELKTRRHADKKRQIEIKNRFRKELGNAAVAFYNGRAVPTRKMIHRKGHWIDPVDYINLTLKPMGL